MTRGRSLGKLAVGGRIVRTDGGASGFRQAFIRALVGVFEIWFTVGRGRRPRRRLHAALAATRRPDGGHLLRAHAHPARCPPLRPASRRCSPRGRRSPTSRGCPTASPGASRSSSGTPSSMRAAPRARGSRHRSPPSRPRTCRRCPPVDPETFLRGVVAVRRDRELRALQLEAQRVAALTARHPARPAGLSDALSAARRRGAASVPVVVELVRPVDRHADVRRLLGGELGQLDAERPRCRRATFSSRAFGSV